MMQAERLPLSCSYLITFSSGLRWDWAHGSGEGKEGVGVWVCGCVVGGGKVESPPVHESQCISWQSLEESRDGRNGDRAGWGAADGGSL